jgi:Peptidase A4 family
MTCSTPDNPDASPSNQPQGIRLFTPPPAGFDPVRASDSELLAHGYPARPDSQQQPELHRHWTEMWSRPMTVITPQFDVMPEGPGGRRLRYANTVGTGWAGMSHAVPAGGDPVTFVTGQWTVPAVVPPQGDHGLSACATWIGIDGIGGASPDIVQTGTTQQIAYGGSQETFAWFEWYPAAACTISNLAVSPGDVMYGLISVYTSTEVAVYLGNMTTSKLVSFMKDATPEDPPVTGASAEWILECPQLKTDIFTILTKFGDVYFDSCLAGTYGSGGLQIVNGGSAFGLHMLGNDDGAIVDIAAPVSLNDRAFKVRYVVPF